MKKITTFLFILMLVCSLAFAQEDTQDEKSKMNAGTFSGMKFRALGPAFMSGRISDIAIDPTDQSVWYVAVASGNAFKTTNAGTTWTPIFDNYGSYSVGCITIDPNNANVIWLGSGENNSQRSVGYGDGVYKSVDGGKSFTNMGLKDSQHIGMIKVDPRDSNVVYVAAQGPLWNAGGDRGLYKTVDGGATWTKVLDIDEHTGASEVYLDPRNPDRVYAITYQRRRHVWTLINGGPGSGIHKSEDGGKTWRKITRGLPNYDMGKIGFAMSHQNPDVLYAVVESDPTVEGSFRSTDRGETWQKVGDYVGGSPQYYNEIFADPFVFDRLYSMDTYLMATDDGGKNWYRVGERDKHVDNHAIAFNPNDPDYFLVGCDGGLYETWDRGSTYKFITNLSIAQFYKCAIDNDTPFYNIYGGTQDNATQGGPTRTNNIHGIRNSDWFVTVFGDGFDPAVDPEDANIVYSQWQHGGLVRFDRGSGEAVDIKPMPEKGEEADRFNWDAALMISPHSHTRLYFGSQRLYRSDDRGDAWTRISDDLTRTEVDRNKLKVMGRVWSVDAVAKNNSTSIYGNIVSVTESPVKEGLIYVGTDDGLVQVTENGGETWTRYETFADVPEMSYVWDLETDLFDENVVYAIFNNHKMGDFKPYVYKSVDKGKTWTSMTGNLPERGSTYALKQDHVDKNLFFVGTEFGVFFTNDGGANWIQLKGGIPTIAVRDIEIQRRENDLALASFGRGFFILDDYTPLRSASEDIFANETHVFPVKKALLYEQVDVLGSGSKGMQGADYFTAPNPEYGAVFTYYLKDSYKTRENIRHEKEEKVKKEGGDNFYPTWEELKLEDREQDPVMVLTIKDADGNVVRRISGPTSAGIHRVAWDLHYPATILGRGGYYGSYGPYVVPGKFTVTLAKCVDGEYTELSAPVEFEVESLNLRSLPGQDKEEILAFQKKLGELQRVIMGTYQAVGEAEERIEAINSALMQTPEADPAVKAEARALELKLMDLREKLVGDPTKPRRSESGDVSITSRLFNAVYGTMGHTYGPTNTHKRQYEIAKEEFAELQPQILQFIEVDLVAFEEKLESLGAPYTTGRKIPVLK